MAEQTSVPQFWVGSAIPEHTRGPVDRTTLALFAGASGDHVPLHIDIDFARQAGHEDVFAHGMLTMAYLGQLITHWVPQGRLRDWSVQFTAITPLHAKVLCTGEIVERLDRGGEECVRITIRARTDAGITTAIGEAIVVAQGRGMS